MDKYDIIVVGAGHAGCEAASAASNIGSKVLLITMDMTKIAQMSCNPAMGGIAKGQITREIDALGGYSGIVTDKSMIQFRMLNKSKGPAMWSPRAQCDRTVFSIKWRQILEENSNIDFWQDLVTSLILKNNSIKGVKTKLGVEFFADAVILTNGTFQNGLIHVGRTQITGGRISEPASFGISEQLSDYGFTVGRMKTGTPARIDGRSIDFSKLEEQKGDPEGGKFSYLDTNKYLNNSKSCYITYTNETVHKILETGFKDSPLYNGTIKSIGPRYCPSIEDKIVTFAEKEKHQLFLEPEGLNTVEYYINGFSSSLPLDVQYKALQNIAGLENVKIFRPGYAIEYDYYDPTQLYHTLETKRIENLFFAGQINGTTGYEEAAAQGIVAGINAHLKIRKKNEFVLQRDEAYIGVLIDDLVTKGVDEPYRMFTSRAEHRILLRQDNADSRLTEKSYAIGLANKERLKVFKEKEESKIELLKFIESTNITPEIINQFLEKKNSAPIHQKTKLKNIVSRPQVQINDLLNYLRNFNLEITTDFKFPEDVINSVEINVKYSGYIHRERLVADKIKRLEDIRINESFNYTEIHSISTEARQKLNKVKPRTIGQASRISGVSPSDINMLLAHIGR